MEGADEAQEKKRKSVKKEKKPKSVKKEKKVEVTCMLQARPD